MSASAKTSRATPPRSLTPFRALGKSDDADPGASCRRVPTRGLWTAMKPDTGSPSANLGGPLHNPPDTGTPMATSPPKTVSSGSPKEDVSPPHAHGHLGDAPEGAQEGAGGEERAFEVDGAGTTWSSDEERRIIRKVDWRLVPFLSLVYLTSFIDKSNIGNARLSNLERDLRLKDGQFDLCLLGFFVGFILTEVPATVALKKLRPSRWLPVIICTWSILMIGMGLVRNFAGLLATRVLLGTVEAVVFPGICLLLQSWYKREETSFRISLFFSSSALAGAFGSILAYAISKMGGLGGRGGWAWIFMVEGFASLVVGLVAPWLVEDFPEDSRFLSAREKAIVLARLRQDNLGTAAEERLSVKPLVAAVKDWKVLLYMLMYIGCAEPLFSLALFTPTIISELGTFSRHGANLLTTPPYAFSFVVTMGTAIWSDRARVRGPFNMLWISVAICGYIILLAVDPRRHAGLSYFAIFLCVGGVSPCIATTITWCGNNLDAGYKRATGLALLFMLGNAGGMVSSVVYFKRDAPRFKRGHGVGLAFSLLHLIATVVVHVWVKRENARRDALYGRPSDPANAVGANPMGDDDEKASARLEQLRAWGIQHLSEAEVEKLGEKHPMFRYMP